MNKLFYLIAIASGKYRDSLVGLGDTADLGWLSTKGYIKRDPTGLHLTEKGHEAIELFNGGFK